MSAHKIQHFTTLEQTISTDEDELFLAKNYLKAAAVGNMSEFCKGLSAVWVETDAGQQMKKQLIIETLLKDAVNEATSELRREYSLEAIGYICQHAHDSLTEDQFKQLLAAILRGMRGVEPSQYVRLAATTALFHSLQFPKAFTEVAGELNSIMEVVGEAAMSPCKDIWVAAVQCLLTIVCQHNQDIEPYFELVTTRLLQASDRCDISKRKLLNAVHEALIYMIRGSSPNCYPAVQRATIMVYERLNRAIQNRNKHLQELLCATLQCLLEKTEKVDAPQISDRLMNAMFVVLQLNAAKSTTLQKEALLVVSTFVDLLGAGFAKYMPILKPFLIAGLQSRMDYRVFCVCIAITGKLCRAVRRQLVPYGDEILTVLIASVEDPSISRDFKPMMLATIGLIAGKVKSHFLKYLNTMLDILRAASSLQRDPADRDNDRHIVDMHNNAMLGYTGILSGLMGISETGQLEPELPHIVGFFNRIVQADEIAESLVFIAIGFLGDLCTSFGSRLHTLFEPVAINSFLAKGALSADPDDKWLCEWVQQKFDTITEPNH